MVLIKEIELALKPQSNEVIAQEDEVLADSILELANTDFSRFDEYQDLVPGAIRKHVEADMREAYPGKPTSRKRIFQTKLTGNILEEASLSLGGIHKEAVAFSPDVESDGFSSLKDKADHKSSDDEADYQSSGNEGDYQSSGDEADHKSSDVDAASNDLDTSAEDLDSDFDGSILPDDNVAEESPCDGEEDNMGTKSDETRGIDIFSSRARDIDADIAKGKSIHNQLSIWEKLIECRIKLQPTIINANKLFQKEALQNFKSSLNKEEEEALTETYSTLGDLMKVLLELQENLLNSAPEYESQKFLKRKANGNELNDELEEPEQKKTKSSKDFLEEIHEDFKPFRNAAIQKWNEKTRVSSGRINKNDFSVFDLPTLKQIEEILLDRERLLRRTRTKKSDYKVLGKSSEQILEEPTTINNDKRKNMNEYDTEIFDDDDFYHKLLRDFIEKKTSDVTDVSKRGRQWLELQKLRNKMKSKVDTRASKGRKLRFTVHNKMVNFMAPVPSYTWSTEARNELFKSLFR